MERPLRVDACQLPALAPVQKAAFYNAIVTDHPVSLLPEIRPEAPAVDLPSFTSDGEQGLTKFRMTELPSLPMTRHRAPAVAL